MHGLTLLVGMGIQFNMTTMIIPALAGLFIGIGFVIERAKQNWFIGIRTPWTMSSPIVWDKTHHLGGLTMKIAGLVALVGVFLPPQTGFMLAFGMIMLGAFIPVVYSYVVFQAELKNKS
jgi:uncharacterized membrane protein